MNGHPEDILRKAGERASAGDVLGARMALNDGIERLPDDAMLRALAGLLACRDGDLVAGVAHLEHAVALHPSDSASRANLVTALLDLGSTARAETVCLAAPTMTDARLQRFSGWFHQRAGRHEPAAVCYRAVIAAQPDDAETWNNLANALAALGHDDEAGHAFGRAAFLRPRDAAPRVNHLKALTRIEQREHRLALAESYAAALPGSAELQFEWGLAAAAMRDVDVAEAAFRRAIRLAPTRVDAYLELGLLLENLNRIDDLAALVDDAERAGLQSGEIDFLHAWELHRRGLFAEASPLAHSAPDTIDPVRRAQLVGEIADRLGDADQAFSAFTTMNRAVTKGLSPSMIDDGERFRREIEADVAATDRTDWTPVPGGERTPVFIAGFPRSGTTLLDTLLMNLPGFHVCEELSMMRAVNIARGDVPLDRLTPEDIVRLRGVYFDELARVTDAPAEVTIVDKFPLHMVHLGLIQRLFPDARIIFCERHPCDVLLSCFVSNFQPNRAMVHFLSLEGAARFYDQVFTAWARARSVVPMAVHAVRYERLVETPAEEMQALMTFLGLPWNAAVIDNLAPAARRGQVSTASYAQVGEPIYQRSAGRWRRYRAHLDPVLPIIAPWVEWMGYAID